MPTSSLIFVLVVAIWAAYLLQHWIRRRDHLSTARSVDRFSEAMRVLERRKPLPESPLAAPEPRSYAVSPARPSRAAVTVKRAAPKPSAEEVVESPRPARVRGGVARVRSGMTGPRLRAASFVLCLVLLAASVVLLALGRVPWWAVGVAGVLLVADLVWLRLAATATARRARREHAARTAKRVRERRVAEAARRRADPPTAGRPVAGDPAAARQDPEPQRVDSVYDPHAADEVASAPAHVAVEEAVAPATAARGPRPGEWQPVPVPPPTYTLKAKAPERPAAPADVTAGSEPFDHTATGAHDTGEGVGGAAAGMPTGPAGDEARPAAEAPYGQDLPFDGLALDEELEDLPPVYAVG